MPRRPRSIGLNLRESLGGVEELLEIADAQEAGAAERGVDDAVGAGECAGVRGGGFGGSRAAPRLDDDHRLQTRRGAGRGYELPRVDHRLEVEQHRVRRPVAGQHVEQVGNVDVGHVAEGNDRREADAAIRRPVEHRRSERAGLRQERQPALAGREVREAGVEPDRRHEEAKRIGSDDPEVMRAGGVEHRLPQAVLLRHAGGQDDDGTSPARAKFSDEAGDCLGGGGDDRKVRRRRQGRDRREAGQSIDVLVVRIDRPDLAMEAPVADIAHHLLANRTLAWGGADDGERLGAKGEFEIADRHGSWSPHPSRAIWLCAMRTAPARRRD